MAVRPTRRIGRGDLAIMRLLERESPGSQRGEILAYTKLACGTMIHELERRLIFSNSRCFLSIQHFERGVTWSLLMQMTMTLYCIIFEGKHSFRT